MNLLLLILIIIVAATINHLSTALATVFLLLVLVGLLVRFAKKHSKTI